MPICRFSHGNTLFGVTPVDNLFIEEYMKHAPAGAVKVYLYGLMNCHYPDTAPDSLSQMALALSMDESDIMGAFFYWQQQGLVRIENADPLFISYAVMRGNTPSFAGGGGETAAGHTEFDTEAQRLFGARILKPRELAVMHEWMDNLGFPPQSALYIVAHALEKKDGRKVHINYLDAIAQSWAQQGLLDIADIEEYLQKQELKRSGAAELLKALGVYNRLPSDAELDFYDKWVHYWHFPKESLLTVIRTRSGSTLSPTFPYLDRILQELYENGAVLPEDIQRYQALKDAQREDVKQLVRALGVSGGVTPGLTKLYQEWTDVYGFDFELILLACRYAAESGAREKLSYLEKVLDNWHDEGVRDTEGARAAHEKFRTTYRETGAARKKLDGLDYQQRTDSLEHIYFNFDEEELS
ncbi:MAG: DnaD domain protein [Christensenellales bacterium]|jgi:DnaD/phage-associated family protein